MYNGCYYVGISGAQCTGKSSIVRKLAEEFDCVTTSESVSRRVAKRSNLDMNDLKFEDEIMREYVNIFKILEDVEDKVVVFDRTPMDVVAYVWAKTEDTDKVIHYRGIADSIMRERFDTIFIMNTDDFEYVDDGLRTRDYRDDLQWRLEALYTTINVTKLIVGGSLDERYKRVKDVVSFYCERLII